MFGDLEPDKHRVLLEHELRAALRILGYLIDEAGGEITVPHRVLGTDYRVHCYSSALDNEIRLSVQKPIGPAR